jgi:hypothetical protein
MTDQPLPEEIIHHLRSISGDEIATTLREAGSGLGRSTPQRLSIAWQALVDLIALR